MLVLWSALCVADTAIPYSHCFAADFTRQDPADAVLKEIGVDERLGGYVPMGVEFKNQDGRAVKLGDCLKGRPAVLSLNYYECPMLCPLMFSSLSRAINQMRGLKLGKDFDVITVSFNPNETLDMARDKSSETYRMLEGVDDPGEAWPFLFGGEAETRAITAATGFRFKELGPGNFAHPSVLIILAPDGKITRYLYGLQQEPFNLMLALTEAANGKIGRSNVINKVLLYCYHYDPAGKKYALAASRIMTASGVVVLIIAGILFLSMRRIEKARRD